MEIKNNIKSLPNRKSLGVWHDGIFYKLKRANIPKYIEHILKSFLTDRCFVVRINEAQLSCRPIQTGVPQAVSCLIFLSLTFLNSRIQTSPYLQMILPSTVELRILKQLQLFFKNIAKKFFFGAKNEEYSSTYQKAKQYSFPYEDHRLLNQLNLTMCQYQGNHW
ncbi:Hypothetical protein CINCED_3A016543 [Cinara cedri]|uniref:Reverse transcriptase domain n=1 Tax=Cinara cedri TaxID=506608 RepID=A0A5E4M9Y0_9HEMI|nr:Hypothetical protein CINCED_3A016543 [Cinara cedri]